MRVAVIGAGIAGLYAAWRLSRAHDVTVFEANDYAGAHTRTVDVEIRGHTYAVETGSSCSTTGRIGTSSRCSMSSDSPRSCRT